MPPDRLAIARCGERPRSCRPPRKRQGTAGSTRLGRSGETAPSIATPGRARSMAPLLPEAPVILSKTRWLAERERSPAAPPRSACGWNPAKASTTSPATCRALRWSRSTSRSSATAAPSPPPRLLREKHGFAGELRAVGNVLSDQIPFMRRVGFDSFEVTHAPTRRALLEGTIAEVTLHYQPAVASEAPAGTRPWLRRADDRTQRGCGKTS